MASRVRVALFAIVAMVLVPGVLVGMAAAADRPPVATSLADAHEPVVAHAAVPARSALPLVPKGLPEAMAIMVGGVAASFSVRRRSLRGLPFRLGDVGDRWRAQLFGAPPSFL
jgi:hypothetical protein